MRNIHGKQIDDMTAISIKRHRNDPAPVLLLYSDPYYSLCFDFDPLIRLSARDSSASTIA